MVKPIVPQIHLQLKTQYHTNDNDTNVNLTGRSTDVAPPPHRITTWNEFVEAANHIATVTPYAIFYPRKIQMNAVIHNETGFVK